MAKRCPSCGYSPIGPFTDNCPICAEPVRNVRSNVGGFPQFANLSPTLRWVIGGAVVAALCVAGCCGLGMWRLGTAVNEAQNEFQRMQAEAEANRRARTVLVAAAELLREFQTDPAAADQKYMGKYLEITGIVERSGRGRFNMPFAVLNGGDENAKLKIECFFEMSDENDDARIRRLGKGQTITVRGEYDGQVSNVQLRECVLVK